MGFFKQVKDMKNMVSEAPGLMAQSSQLAANAQAMAAAQQAAIEQAAQASAPAAAAAAEGGVAPIAGVDLALYATISKSFAEVGYDQSRGAELAARHGVAATDWDTAVAGWNARMQADPAVAKQFNALYTGR